MTELSFVLTITGKVQKYLMRERMCSELGLVEEKTASETGRLVWIADQPGLRNFNT